MYILVDSTKYDYGFCKYLSKIAGRMILSLVNPAKLLVWDEHFGEEFSNRNRGKKVKAFSIIKKGACNLVVVKKGKTFQVEINRYIFLPKFGRYLEEMCREINFGTMGMTAYPIFTKVFTEISNNIEKYHNKYLLGAVM